MKRFQTIALFGMLAAQAAIAAQAAVTRDTSGSLNDFPLRYLPVLVNVDARGNVTDVSPSTQLTPMFDRLLRQNLDDMITGPATDSKGHPTSSQFVMNLVLKTTPRKEGNYDASFAYVSTSPVPAGSWYWVHINGRRLALASRSNMSRSQRLYFERERYNGYRPTNSFYHSQPMATPAIRGTPTPVPVPAPPTNMRGH